MKNKVKYLLIALIAIVILYFLFKKGKGFSGYVKKNNPEINPEYMAFIDRTKKWLRASTGDQQTKIVEGAKSRGITYEESLTMAAEWYAEQQKIPKYL
jgi:hypothetical protein